MDLALAWADPRVIDVVQTKWESLPAPSDKKGKGGKGGKGKGGAKTARPTSGPAGDQKENQAPASQVGIIDVQSQICTFFVLMVAF